MEVTSSLLLGPFYLVKWPVNPNILAANVQDFPHNMRIRFTQVKSLPCWLSQLRKAKLWFHGTHPSGHVPTSRCPQARLG